jgi:hypothetical protein
MARFEDVLSEFWDPAASPMTQPPLTTEAVALAEKVLGVTLPLSLLEVLRRQNGGLVAPQWRACPAEPNYWADDHVPFDHLFGIGPVDADITLLTTPYLIEEWDLPRPIVLISGEGHYWIALDYRAGASEPSIAWLDNELGLELPLAVDFRAFVELLRPGPDYDR